MTQRQPSQERRGRLRLDGGALQVAVRPRGRLAAVPAQALDFNRYGMAVQTAVPLAKEAVVYLQLRCREVQLENVVGVIHNCVRRGEAFRCGIRFRPGSGLQHDRAEVQALLLELERALAMPAELPPNAGSDPAS